MPQATIFVELDTSSVTQGSKVLTADFGNALRTVQAQANTSFPAVTQKSDELSKTLGRLSNSRAPQFMGLLTSQAVASIPALQGSAAATGLLSTATFGLQRALNSLVGPAGVVLIGVGVLATLTASFLSSGDSTQKLSDKTQQLANEYARMRDLGLSATATQRELDKALKNLQDRIDELQKSLDGQLSTWDKIRNAIALQYPFLGNLFQLIGITGKSYDVLSLEIEKTETAMKSAKKTMEESVPTFEVINDAFAKFRNLPSVEQLQKGIEGVSKAVEEAKPVIESFEIFAPEDITRMRAAQQINEALRVQGVLKNLETEKKQLQLQTIQNIASSFENSFAEMLRGGKVAWNELLQYWYTELLASAVMAALSRLFSFSLGGGLFTSLFGFQTGTPFVPQTGAYVLHKGEAVIPAESNPFVNQTTNNWGGNTYNIYIRGEITEESIRRELLPKLKRMSEERNLIF